MLPHDGILFSSSGLISEQLWFALLRSLHMTFHLLPFRSLPMPSTSCIKASVPSHPVILPVPPSPSTPSDFSSFPYTCLSVFRGHCLQKDTHKYYNTFNICFYFFPCGVNSIHGHRQSQDLKVLFIFKKLLN